MTTQVTESPSLSSSTVESTSPASSARRRQRSNSPARSLLAHSEPLIWLTGGALVLAIIMIVGLLGLVMRLGLDTFRPRPLVEVRLRDGRVLMGEIAKQNHTTLTADVVLGEPPEVQQWLVERLAQVVDPSAGLVEELTERVERLQAEAADIERRREQARRELNRMDRARRRSPSAPSDNPFDRGDMIRHDPSTHRMQQTRARQVVLEQRAEALLAEIEGARQAVDRFQQLPQIDARAILDSNEMTRRAGIAGLIQLAKQADPSSVRFRRRMIRTGNYELTNEHFNWVTDYQIADNGESQPARGTLVERVAWGRFYGEPQSFAVKHPRRATQDERELATLLAYWQARQLTISANDEMLSAFNAGLEQIQDEHDRERVRATKAFVSELAQPLPIGEQLVLHTAAGQAKSPQELSTDDEVLFGVAALVDSDAAWREFQRSHPQVLRWRKRREHLEKHALGTQFARQEAARLNLRQTEIDQDLSLLPQARALLQVEEDLDALRERQELGDAVVAIARRRYGESSKFASLTRQMRDAQQTELQREQLAKGAERNELRSQLQQLPPAAAQAVLDDVSVEQAAAKASEVTRKEIDDLRELDSRYELQMITADGQSKGLAAGEIVRAFQPNRLSRSSVLLVYLSRWWEFVTQEPREANSEGGVMPAIWGTVAMTLIMSIAVVPFGVVAALYLREYAKSGPIVSLIRIAINNLAGVPSIVFGVFGLGFFCYIIGAYLDGGPRNAGFKPLPTLHWYLTLGALAIIAASAFFLGLFGLRGQTASRRAWQHLLGYASLASWLLATVLLVVVLLKTPFFTGFHEASLPNPHWGKGGVVWAALTLALMTLPVVIVATEEALSAVPNSMREGSFGCGASRWQTICRIVLPHAMPGIMTGMILAMARGAGEVAPLMLVGAVKLAPELPIDLTYPFLHGNRSFMHLGFHVFDVGFQSQNSEAAKPMVYTTTLLLILIITILNLIAIRLRAYLRRRFATGHF
jgi:phosphate transport system permease protein